MANPRTGQLGTAPRALRGLARPFAVVAIYHVLFVVADAASAHLAAGTGVTAWYPGAALNLALVAALGPRWAWAIVSAPALWPLLSGQPLTPGRLLASTGVALGFAGLGWVLRRHLGTPPALVRARDAVMFGAVALAGPLPIAACGATGAWFGTGAASTGWAAAVFAWWTADAVGIAVLGPFLLAFVVPRTAAWVQHKVPSRRRDPAAEPLRRITSAGAYAIAGALATWIVVGLPPGALQQLFYLCFLPVLWSALRGGIGGASVSTLLVNVGLLFAMPLLEVHVSGIDLQFRALVLAGTGLFVGAIASDYRLANRALREAATTREALLQAIPDLMFRQADDGTFLDAYVPEGAWLRLAGGPSAPADLAGRRPEDVLPASLARLVRDLARVVRREGRAHWAEHAVELGGQTFWIEARVAPCGADETLSILRDVTVQRRAEAERRRIETRLQQAQKLESLGVLAGGIAHDFNNLLAAILGNAGLALLDMPKDSPATRCVQDIEVASLRAAELTRQMLAYSGRGKFVVAPFDLSQLVTEMGHLLEITLSHRASIEYRIASGLPLIQGDASQVRQVVMNLITNASDALGGAPGSIRVTTGAAECRADELALAYPGDELPGGTYVFVEVADTGCGMDETTRARLFEPFFTTKFTGRGLGMAAVLGIVRGHRGAITLKTAPGEGSTFRVLFPAAPAGSRAALVTAPQTVVSSRAIVVLDEDEPRLADKLRALAETGFAARGFTTAERAFAAVADDPRGYRAVLLDVTRHGLDGPETLARFRARHPELPVVLASDHDEDCVRRRFGTGFAGIVRTPCTAAALGCAVRAALDARHAGSQGPSATPAPAG